MILYEKNNIKIKVLDDSIVRKTFNHSIKNNFEWLVKYNKLREWDPRYVEVYGVGSNYIDMAYVKNAISMLDIVRPTSQILKKYDLNQRKKFLVEYLDIIVKAQIYLSIDDKFTHTDLWFYNVLINEDNKLVVIDPDSCFNDPNYIKLLGSVGTSFNKTLSFYYDMLNNEN
jgi:thiamine kinase-like enzyme